MTMKKTFWTIVAPTSPATVDPSMFARKSPSIVTVPAEAGRIAFRPTPPA
jgi:hypothetical protein